jgi:hypothetical protein
MIAIGKALRRLIHGRCDDALHSWQQTAEASERDLGRERGRLGKLQIGEEAGREGIVVVHDSVTGEYLGCTGREYWEELLAETATRLCPGELPRVISSGQPAAQEAGTESYEEIRRQREDFHRRLRW